MNYIKSNKNKIVIYNNPYKAVNGADVIFSDKVISLNDKVDKNKKLKDFKKNFRISKDLMKLCPKAIFLHCLPRGTEVEENVFKSKQSKVWQQAINRGSCPKINITLLSWKITVAVMDYLNFYSSIR